jgi:hypothetical protein
VMVWFSSMVVPDFKQHSRLGTCCRGLVGKHWTIHCTVKIWHPVIFICFLPWRSICQDVVSPAMKTSDTLPSCGWCIRDIHSMCMGWTNLSCAVMGASTVKGCTLKNSVPAKPSLCGVSFLCQNLAFDFWVL